MSEEANQECRELVEKLANLCIGVDPRDVVSALTSLLINVLMWSLDCTGEEALDCLISNMKLAREQSSEVMH